MKYRYTKEQLVTAAHNSSSIRQVLKYLGLKEAGGNYLTIQQRITEWKIDISHFSGKGWNKDLQFKPNPKKALNEILTANSTFQSHKLRKRLIDEGYFEAMCYKCQATEWMGQPIPLELEHIDGDRSNNRIENLTLLCPNCHAMTETWRRRKKIMTTQK